MDLFYQEDKAMLHVMHDDANKALGWQKALFWDAGEAGEEHNKVFRGAYKAMDVRALSTAWLFLRFCGLFENSNMAFIHVPEFPSDISK